MKSFGHSFAASVQQQPVTFILLEKMLYCRSARLFGVSSGKVQVSVGRQVPAGNQSSSRSSKQRGKTKCMPSSQKQILARLQTCFDSTKRFAFINVDVNFWY